MPVSSRRSFPLSASQSLTLLSKLPLASVFPSGLKRTDQTMRE
jgi:hypothetical protein